MIVSRIQENIAAYKSWLQTIKNHPFIYKWESIVHFQTHWNPMAEEPAAMFDLCFYNTENRSLWQQEQWQPKRMMLLFWRQDPQTLRWMFEDLFNESKEVEGRIGRFLFGCDELLKDHKKLQVTSVENNHFHSDYRMVALYLAFQYPEQYAPYDFAAFQKTMEVLGARDVPQENDIVRYFKVIRTLKSFLDKDPEVQTALNTLLKTDKHFTGPSVLIAEDLCRFIAEKNA